MAARNMEVVLLIHRRAGTLDVNRSERLMPLRFTEVGSNRRRGRVPTLRSLL